MATEKFKNPEDLIKKLHDEKIYFGIKIDTENGFNPADKAYQTVKKILNLEKDAIIPLNVYNTKVPTVSQISHKFKRY